MEQPEDGWQTHGPLKGGTVHVRNALVRLIWCVFQPERGLMGMPPGWIHGRLPERISICPTDGCHELADKVAPHLESLVAGTPLPFMDWVKASLVVDGQLWQKTVFEEDLEIVSTFFTARHSS